MAAASSCSVSLRQSFNPDVLHGAVKCVLFILVSACQSTESSCCWDVNPEKPRGAGDGKLPLPTGHGRITQIIWQPLTVSIGVLQPTAGPGQPAGPVGANHSTSSCLILSPGLCLCCDGLNPHHYFPRLSRLLILQHWASHLCPTAWPPYLHPAHQTVPTTPCGCSSSRNLA